MRARPKRLDRLPEQYFTALLARVAAAAARDGETLVDLGRGNPDIGPPPHVAEALCAAAAQADTHGYAPFAGLPALKEAIATRYRDVYGVDVDPEREVAVLPGAKTGLMEFAQVCVERGEAIVLPDPGYPDYRSAVALAAARHVQLPLLADARPDWDAAPSEAAALYLNYPSNPVAACAPDGVFEESIAWAQRAGAWVMHDFAYGDLVFDGRKPASFLSVDGAREVGFELFSMSKSYGMAGWRLGFAVGNAEIVARIENLQNHQFAGIFMAMQAAGIAALTGPQDTVEERRSLYEARRDRALAALAGYDARSEGTFFVWFHLPDGLTAEELLVEHRVAVAPGEGFGEQGRGWARLSLATSDDKLDLGLERLRGLGSDPAPRGLTPLSERATKSASRRASSFVERDGRLRDAVVPDAEAHLRLLAEVARHAQRTTRAVRMRPEELDGLATLGDTAQGTEAEPRFELLPTGRAGQHAAELMPSDRPFRSSGRRRAGSRPPAPRP